MVMTTVFSSSPSVHVPVEGASSTMAMTAATVPSSFNSIDTKSSVSEIMPRYVSPTFNVVETPPCVTVMDSNLYTPVFSALPQPTRQKSPTTNTNTLNNTAFTFFIIFSSFTGNYIFIIPPPVFFVKCFMINFYTITKKRLFAAKFSDNVKAIIFIINLILP